MTNTVKYVKDSGFVSIFKIRVMGFVICFRNQRFVIGIRDSFSKSKIRDSGFGIRDSFSKSKIRDSGFGIRFLKSKIRDSGFGIRFLESYIRFWDSSNPES